MRLGLPMGAPYFQYKQLCTDHDVTVLSSNYALYGDMSARVMIRFKELVPKVEVYSIDEAFLDFSNLPDGTDLVDYAKYIKLKIFKDIGIPISIGIGHTKTLAKLGKNHEALAAYQKASDVAPKDPYPYLNAGKLLFNLGVYEGSIELFDKVIKLDPLHESIFCLKADALAKLKQYNQAIYLYNKAIELNPQDVSPYNNKGIVLNNIGLYKEALEAFDMALKLDPSNVKIYINKGLSLVGLNRYKEAIEAYNIALKIEPNNSLAINSKNYVLKNMRLK